MERGAEVYLMGKKKKGYLFCLSGIGKKVKMAVHPLRRIMMDYLISEVALPPLCFLKEEKSSFNHHLVRRGGASPWRGDRIKSPKNARQYHMTMLWKMGHHSMWRCGVCVKEGKLKANTGLSNVWFQRLFDSLQAMCMPILKCWPIYVLYVQ